MSEPVADVLYRVQQANRRIGEVLVELLNHPDPAAQSVRLRELGRHLGTLSAECLARAAEADGRVLDAPSRVIIDASDGVPIGQGTDRTIEISATLAILTDALHKQFTRP